MSDNFNIFQDGLFQGCSQMKGQKDHLKSVTHPTMMILGTVIPYSKKIHEYVSKNI